MNPIVIANKIIQEKKALTIMELLKLLYIAHGYSLAILGNPLFKGQVEAWPYGPVIREVYSAFRNTQGIYINKPIDVSDCHDKIGSEAEAVIKEVIEIYKDKNGWELSALTHEDNSPWTKIVSQKGFYNVIPNDLIKEYYKGLISKGC